MLLGETVKYQCTVRKSRAQQHWGHSKRTTHSRPENASNSVATPCLYVVDSFCFCLTFFCTSLGPSSKSCKISVGERLHHQTRSIGREVIKIRLRAAPGGKLCCCCWCCYSSSSCNTYYSILYPILSYPKRLSEDKDRIRISGLRREEEATITSIGECQRCLCPPPLVPPMRAAPRSLRRLLWTLQASAGWVSRNWLGRWVGVPSLSCHFSERENNRGENLKNIKRICYGSSKSDNNNISSSSSSSC